MSFGIGANGTPEGVINALKASNGHGDTSHHDAARDMLLVLVSTIPEHQREKVFVMASASGHHDFTNGSQIHGNVDLKFSVGPIAK